MGSEAKKYRGAGLLVIVLLVLATSGYFMHLDRQLVGDEVVTYGMANSTSAGWMLSTGRVRAYFEAEILEDSLSATIKNLADFGMDILKNKRGAAYFSFERPTESGWYSNDEVRDWFAIEPGERFRFGDVYLNVMGDDANSFLYYMLVHAVGSFLPMISSLKWSAYIVNAFAFAAALICLYKVSGYFLEEHWKRLLVCALFGFSVGGLDIGTYLRTYMLAIAFQLGLLGLHLHLFEAVGREDKKRMRNIIIGLLVLYPLGYVTHYTTGLWAVVLGIVAIVYICRAVPKNCVGSALKNYIGAGILAIGIGVLLDPMSVLGLVSKLSDAGKPLGQAMAESFTAYTGQVFGGWPLFVIFVAVFGINAAHSLTAGKKDGQNRKSVSLWALEWTIIGYCLLVVCLTKFAYFKVAYPLTFIAVVMELEYFDREIAKKNWMRWIYSALTCVFILNSLFFTFRTKQTEVIWYDEVQEALAEADTENIVLIRPHAEGYDCFPMLSQYERVFVLTTPEAEYQMLAEDEELQEAECLTVLITNVKADGADFAEWSDEKDTGTMEVIYEAQNRAVLKWTK